MDVAAGDPRPESRRGIRADRPAARSAGAVLHRCRSTPWAGLPNLKSSKKSSSRSAQTTAPQSGRRAVDSPGPESRNGRVAPMPGLSRASRGNPERLTRSRLDRRRATNHRQPGIAAPTIGPLPRLGAVGGRPERPVTATRRRRSTRPGPQPSSRPERSNRGWSAAGGGGSTTGGGEPRGRRHRPYRGSAPTGAGGSTGPIRAIPNSGTRVGGALRAQRPRARRQAAGQNPTDAWSACATWHGSRWARKTTTNLAHSMVVRPSVWPSTSFRAPMPWMSRTSSSGRWSSSGRAFRKASSYAIPYDTTPFIRESVVEVVQDLARGRRSWLRWWCSCSSRTGGRRSSRWWPCRSRSSAPSPSWPRWDSA